MKLRHILVAASLSFALGLVALAPAASVYGWLVGASDTLPVRLHGVTGTLLKGAATQITRGGQIVAADVRWKLSPAHLLLGRAQYHLQTDAPPLLFDGDVGIGLGGTVRVSDARANGELRALAAIAGQTFIPVNGQLGLRFDRLTLADRWPTDALGQIQIIGLSWALGREPAVLGDFEADVEHTDGGIVARVSSLQGVVDVGGTASVTADRAYALDLQLRALPDAPPMVGSLLQSLGRPDAHGYYRLQRGGSAPAPAAPAAPAHQEHGTDAQPASDTEFPSFLLPG